METKTMHQFPDGDRPKRLKALQRILQQFIRFETPEMAKTQRRNKPLGPLLVGGGMGQHQSCITKGKMASWYFFGQPSPLFLNALRFVQAANGCVHKSKNNTPTLIVQCACPFDQTSVQGLLVYMWLQQHVYHQQRWWLKSFLPMMAELNYSIHSWLGGSS